VSKLSNLSCSSNSWYIRNGLARNEKDEMAVQQFSSCIFLCGRAGGQSGVYEKLYQYQSFAGMPLSGRISCFITVMRRNGMGRLEVDFK